MPSELLCATEHLYTISYETRHCSISMLWYSLSTIIQKASIFSCSADRNAPVAQKFLGLHPLLPIPPSEPHMWALAKECRGKAIC